MLGEAQLRSQWKLLAGLDMGYSLSQVPCAWTGHRRARPLSCQTSWVEQGAPRGDPRAGLASSGPHDEHWVRGVHGQGRDTCDPRADPVDP